MDPTKELTLTTSPTTSPSSAPTPSLSRTSPSTPSSPRTTLLSLPTELLHQIFLQLTPKSYYILSHVHPRLRLIAENSSTQQAFATTWISSYYGAKLCYSDAKVAFFLKQIPERMYFMFAQARYWVRWEEKVASKYHGGTPRWLPERRTRAVSFSVVSLRVVQMVNGSLVR